MVYLHNDTYQVQVDCDGMSNECHVILLYFLSGLRFKAATYIKMLGNCGQALDSGDVSVKAVHFSSNKYHIIQFHYIYQDVGKLLSSPGLRGCFLHFPVGLLPHEVAGQKLSKKIVHSNNIIRLSGLRSQENISEN